MLLRPPVAFTAISSESGITQWPEGDHGAIRTLKSTGVQSNAGNNGLLGGFRNDFARRGGHQEDHWQRAMVGALSDPCQERFKGADAEVGWPLSKYCCSGILEALIPC